jgi:5'-nucleotidase
MGTRTASTRLAVTASAVALMVVLGACSSSSTSSSSTTTAKAGTTTTAAAGPLRILVTNDDGYSAPGIDAVVQGLHTLPDVAVSVVAPLTNQSGSGSKTTPGTLTVTDVKTASGYAAKAVAGYPADTVIWAVDDHGLSQKPQVVISGVNFGQNIGSSVDISGTVGAARAAASRGIPALASSAGLPPSGVAAPDFATVVTQVEKWVTDHRAALVAGKASSPVLLQNLNGPTCAAGTTPRALQTVPVDLNTTVAQTLAPANCASTATNPTADVQAFDEGFQTLSDLSVTPSTTTTTG